MQKVNVKLIFRPSIFWDADNIDADKHAAYVIARVLDYGDIEDVRKIRELYSDEKIIETIRTRRGMFPKTGKYWAVKFNIPFFEELLSTEAIPVIKSLGSHLETFYLAGGSGLALQ